MNTQTPTLPPLTTSATADGEFNVGILFNVADHPTLTALLATDKPAVLMFIARGLEMFLRERGLCLSLGACGDLSEGVVLFKTTDRPKALVATREYLAAPILLNFANIYDWHESELVWRAYHTSYPGVRFEDFTTDTVIQRMRAKQEAVAQLTDTLRQQFGPTDNPA